MKSLGNFPDPFIEEIAGQPDAIRRAAAGLGDQLPVLERLAGSVSGRTVLFTGMGSSYFACYPAVIELARRTIAAIHVDSAELLHFRRGLVGSSTLLVAVSQSGASAEVVRLIEGLDHGPNGPLVIGVTNGGDNALARLATFALDTRAGVETGPSTMTFASSLIVLAAISRILGGRSAPEVVSELAEEAEAAARALERQLALPSLPEELAAWFGDRTTSVILGRGPARAAAEMGALTLKEAVGMPIESLETAQFRHGPLELAGPDLSAIVIATEPETRELDVGLAGELVEAGAAVLVVTETGDAPAGATRIELGRLDRALAPAVSILPAQLLAWKLAVLHGRQPGSYLRAAKVTTRE